MKTTSSRFWPIILLAAFVSAHSGSSSVSALSRGEEVEGSEIRLGEFYGWGFRLQIPPQASACFSSPVEDFGLYEVRVDDRKLLAIYAGNQPKFPQRAPSSAHPEDVKIDGVEAISYRWVGAEGSLHRELLVELKAGFPSYLHIQYGGLLAEEKEQAEKMISSILLSAAGPPP